MSHAVYSRPILFSQTLQAGGMPSCPPSPPCIASSCSYHPVQISENPSISPRPACQASMSVPEGSPEYYSSIWLSRGKQMAQVSYSTSCISGARGMGCAHCSVKRWRGRMHSRGALSNRRHFGAQSALSSLGSDHNPPTGLRNDNLTAGHSRCRIRDTRGFTGRTARSVTHSTSLKARCIPNG
jgi:hypothetical protein